MEHKTALILDTAGEQAGVILYHGGVFFRYLSEKGARRHTPILLDAIDTLLQKAGITTSDIKEVAVVTGPGSFTGIRVGVATANGLSAAIGAKRIALTSLEPFAAESDCVVVLDCKHGNYYALKRQNGVDEYLNLTGNQPYGYGLPVIEANGVSFDGLERVYLQKSAAGNYVQALQPFYLKDSSAERNAK